MRYLGGHLGSAVSALVDGALDDATIKQFQDGVTTDRIAFVDGFAENFFKAGGTLKVSDNQVRYAQELAHLASAKGTLDCIAAFSLTDFRGDLAKITIPTLVIHGTADKLVQPSGGERTAEVVPDAKLLMIEGMGHDLPPPLWGRIVDAFVAHATEHP